MAPQQTLYKLKQSPGKGLGIFATQHIKPGTTIMRDRVLMKVYKPDHRPPDEALVVAAYNSLDNSQKKESFLRLHEGSRPYSSKVMRIYMANSFRSRTEFSNYVLPKMSRVNHSCTPNTEKAADDDDKDIEILVAAKPIAKGEEVFLGYLGFPASMTRTVRTKLLSARYGFDCDCLACTLDPASTAIGDAPVRIEPVDWSNIDLVTPENVDTIEGAIGRVRLALGAKPTLQEETAYWIMAAKLCQAEGFISSQVATFYKQAATRLRTHMHCLAEGRLVISDSARILYDWLKEAGDIANETRGYDAMVTKDMRAAWKETMATDVGLAMRMIKQHDDAYLRNDGSDCVLHDAFAIALEDPKQGRVAIIPKDGCLELLRRNLGKNKSGQ
ncbi:hypothetical protein LTR56_015821 [Elasticomyces elasticus]|nr:hypothetical protein LTR56_015821 [Elasticomyces elasticus]KAK3644104.1 hypothetical protein LTR22_015427 [Elasticomyces elasticus]KAK4922027.1 hypothetical protein LTR49_010613 [Elasticomyces elasticus]KAK5768792.1 hypothetical protein LTS12_000851 [Elasticomyces elasticus]